MSATDLDWKGIDRQTTEAELAQAADDTERDRLLALLKEHLTVRVSVEPRSFDGGRQDVRVTIVFDGEEIDNDYDTIEVSQA